MALNFPGPYEIRIFYTTGNANFPALQHVQHLSLNLTTAPPAGTPFSGLLATLRNATTVDLAAVTTTWANAIKGMFNSHANNVIQYAELWNYTPGSFDASYISTLDLSIAGTSASALNVAGQSISTFRTQQGGIFKLSFQETVIVPGPVDLAPYALTELEAIRAAIVAGTTYPWIARDTSFPFASIAHYPGQSEAIFKQRYRP